MDLSEIDDILVLPQLKVKLHSSQIVIPYLRIDTLFESRAIRQIKYHEKLTAGRRFFSELADNRGGERGNEFFE